MEIRAFDIDNAEAIDDLLSLQDRLNDATESRQLRQLYQSHVLKGFLCYINKTPAASLILFRTGIQSDYKEVLFFGHFEALDMQAGLKVTEALLDHCRTNYKGCRLVGPVNGTTWNRYRLADGHAPALFANDIPGNPLYTTILGESGFDILHSYMTNQQTDMMSKSTFYSHEFRICTIEKTQVEALIEDIYVITMEAFRLSPLFSPVPENIFRQKYLEQLQFLDTSLMPVAFDQHGKIVGYTVCYPAAEPHVLTVKTIARKTGRAYAGVGRLLSEKIVEIAVAHQYKKLLHAFMYNQNKSAALSGLFNGEPVKTYHIYYKDL